MHNPDLESHWAVRIEMQRNVGKGMGGDNFLVYGLGGHEGSKRLILDMPEVPARMPAQASATVLPTGETMPNPVMTTLRRDKIPPAKSALDAATQAFLA